MRGELADHGAARPSTSKLLFHLKESAFHLKESVFQPKESVIYCFESVFHCFESGFPLMKCSPHMSPTG